MSPLDAVLRLRFVVIGAIAAMMFVVAEQHLRGDTDWTFFTFGSDTLFGAHRDFVRGAEVIPGTGQSGLHLYASYPFLQIGPPALLLAAVVQLAPGGGLMAAAVVIQLMGLGLLLVLDRAFVRSRSSRAAMLVGGGSLMFVWTSLMQARHLDDALALACVAAAAACLTSERAIPLGTLLGLAAASKPWAVGAVPLLLGLPTWRGRRIALALSSLVVLASWGPFVLADHKTLMLGQVHLPVATDSIYALFGVRDLRSDQAVRLGQFLVGGACAGYLAYKNRWPVALLAAFSCRLLLEPYPYAYYSASFLVSCLIADLCGSGRRLPILSVLGAVTWITVPRLSSDAAAAWRLVVYAGFLALTFALTRNFTAPVVPRRSTQREGLRT